MAKLAQAVTAIDHGAALIAGNMLRQELRSARWHFANGLAHDENLQRELAAIERPAEVLLAKAPAVSDAALNAMRASHRSSKLWDREAADWCAAIRGSKATESPTRGVSNAANARRAHTPPATQTGLDQLDRGVDEIAADSNDSRVHSSSTAAAAPGASAYTFGHSAERVAARRSKRGFAGGQRLGAERAGAEWFALKGQALTQELAHFAQIRRQPEPGAETERVPATAPSAKEIAAADDWLFGDVADGGGDATPAAALAAPPEGLGLGLTRAIANSSGEPLPAGLKAELEAAAGADLSHVRVHHDGAAAQAAAAVVAKAFAVGKDIYFAANAYDPVSVEGQRLIAHEVAHTLQPEGQMGVGVTTHNDPVEREANAFVEKFAKGEEDGQAIGFTATRTRLPRYPGVVPSALAEDKIRWIDDADHSLGKAGKRIAATSRTRRRPGFLRR